MKVKSENTVHKNQDKAIQNSLRDPSADKQEISLEDNRPEALLQRKLVSSISESTYPIQREVSIGGVVAKDRDIPVVRKMAARQDWTVASQVEEIFRKRMSEGRYEYGSLQAAVKDIIKTMRDQPTTASVTAPRQPDVSGRATTSTRRRQAPPPPTVVPAPTTRASEPITLPVAPAQITSEYSGKLRMKPETETHIGFEIEAGGHYRFPIGVEKLTKFVNQTLAVFVSQPRPTESNPTPDPVPVLEMIIDDPKGAHDKVVVQIEFRTVPLRFDQINENLGTTIKSAINTFPYRQMFSSFPQTPVTVGTDRGKGHWIPTPLLSELASLGSVEMDDRPYLIEGTKAQHATTSIELRAFTELKDTDQHLLFPGIAGTTIRGGDRQETLDRIARRILRTSTIDATTIGRNQQSTMAKSPIESLLAADSRLRAPDSVLSTSVKVSNKSEDTYALDKMGAVSGRIRSSGCFPIMQGQGEGEDKKRGYRAVAEKLQPPLLDTVSHELRVLVEHRDSGIGTLVRAVNEALKGNDKLLNKYSDAARRMDSLRRPVPTKREEPVSSE